MSGLIYEVAWVRSLELIFGTTTFAVATVLAAFMGGLACGSYFMGRLSARFERFHPLRLYGLLECLIGLVALVIPLLLQCLVPVYQLVWKSTHGSFIAFSLLRFALSALVLLVPTFLMGATLPVVSRFVSGESRLGEKRIGLLYAFNTLGAVLGCAAAGLALFPSIGLARTQWVGVALNLVAAAGGFALAARSARG
ncbi:MAG TPA: fused MFS/spermidine synthase, partial [Candidatus Binatia bacterium]|nr:fused MFS/spermidine synthase [Candidatus Binatia bacterium]